MISATWMEESMTVTMKSTSQFEIFCVPIPYEILTKHILFSLKLIDVQSFFYISKSIAHKYKSITNLCLNLDAPVINEILHVALKTQFAAVRQIITSPQISKTYEENLGLSFLLAAIKGNKEIFQAIKCCPQFSKIDCRYIDLARWFVIKKNYWEIIESCRLSISFDGIDLSDISSFALVQSTKRAYKEIVDALIGCLKKQLNPESLHVSLFLAAYEGNQDIFKVIWNCYGYLETSIKCLNLAFWLATQKNHEDMLRANKISALCNHADVSDIGYFTLPILVKHGCGEILQTIFMSNLFNRITATDSQDARTLGAKLAESIQIAIRDGHREIAQDIIKCSGFKWIAKVDITCLQQAAIFAAAVGYVEIFRDIINYPEFMNDPRLRDLGTALVDSVKYHHLKIVKIIMDDDRREYIRIVDLNKALQISAENGDEEIVKNILAHPQWENERPVVQNFLKEALQKAREKNHSGVVKIIEEATR